MKRVYNVCTPVSTTQPDILMACKTRSHMTCYKMDHGGRVLCDRQDL